MSVQAKEIRLKSRPTGWPTEDTFEFAETELPSPKAGEVLVRNTFMSVDPYMRGRMNDVKSYVPPYELGKALEGGAVGEVVEFEGVSPSHFLGALGMPALTAYVGLLDIASFKPGETVFVSGAAGAVGSLAGQIAKLKGAKRVIGSAGSAEKVKHLTEKLGFDTAFNYRDGKVTELLVAAAPDGIDVFFDNVGGDHLEAALWAFNTYGRVAVCGSISGYNEEKLPPGPRNMHLIVGKRLTLRGFIILDHGDRFKDMIAEVGGWLASGKLVAEETVVDGLDNAPAAFLGMMRGENTGKMVVRL